MVQHQQLEQKHQQQKLSILNIDNSITTSNTTFNYFNSLSAASTLSIYILNWTTTSLNNKTNFSNFLVSADNESKIQECSVVMDDEELETYMRSDRGDTSVVEEEGINIIMNAENDKALTIYQIINTDNLW